MGFKKEIIPASTVAGAWIKKQRIKKFTSIRHAAAHAGISYPPLANFERGVAGLTRRSLAAFATVLNTTPDALGEKLLEKIEQEKPPTPITPPPPDNILLTLHDIHRTLEDIKVAVETIVAEPKRTIPVKFQPATFGIGGVKTPSA